MPSALGSEFLYLADLQCLIFVVADFKTKYIPVQLFGQIVLSVSLVALCTFLIEGLIVEVVFNICQYL